MDRSLGDDASCCLGSLIAAAPPSLKVDA